MLLAYDIDNSPLKTVPRVMRWLWARMHLREDTWLNLAWLWIKFLDDPIEGCDGNTIYHCKVYQRRYSSRWLDQYAGEWSPSGSNDV